MVSYIIQKTAARETPKLIWILYDLCIMFCFLGCAVSLVFCSPVCLCICLCIRFDGMYVMRDLYGLEPAPKSGIQDSRISEKNCNYIE